MPSTDATAGGRRLALAAAMLLLAGGCLLTGTKVFTYALGDIQIQGSFFASATAEFAENAVYREHRDDIDHIDEVGLTTRIVNGTFFDATVSIRLSDDPTITSPTDIRNDTVPLLMDIVVPAGGERVITYRESVENMQNADRLRTLVEEGSATLFAVSDGFFNLTLRELTLVVTFTVGL